MKKLIALLLVVVIAASALSVAVYASSVVRSGTHRGNEWKVTHSVTGGYTADATTYFTYARNNIISIEQWTYYHRDGNPEVTFSHREFDTTEDGCAFCFYPENYPYVMDSSVATCKIIKGGFSKSFTAYP